jgi:hypothetical protein
LSVEASDYLSSSSFLTVATCSKALLIYEAKSFSSFFSSFGFSSSTGFCSSLGFSTGFSAGFSSSSSFFGLF